MTRAAKACLCGHPRDAHRHYRGGSNCGLCSEGECSRYRRPRPWRRRLPPVPECGWCNPLGHYSDNSNLPSGCDCCEACGAPWCQARVTA